MKVKRNSFKTVSKLLQNCFLSLSFHCSDSLKYMNVPRLRRPPRHVGAAPKSDTIRWTISLQRKTVRRVVGCTGWAEKSRPLPNY